MEWIVKVFFGVGIPLAFIVSAIAVLMYSKGISGRIQPRHTLISLGLVGIAAGIFLFIDPFHF